MGNCQNHSASNDPMKAEKIKKSNSNNLTIKSYTWNRDSHGLFDYESKGITKAQHKLPEPGVIIRSKEEIKIIPSESFQGESEDIKKLASIEVRDGYYVVNSDLIQVSDEFQAEKKLPIEEGVGELCVWGVVKSLKTSKGTSGHELSVGDYLKLGRVRFRIKQLQALETDAKKGQANQNFFFGSNANILNMDDDNQTGGIVAEETGDKADTASNCQNTCRICLGDNDEEDNPFITPCKCDGTMKCIHVKCLQQWLKSRLHPKQTPFSISFVWKAFDCELCKHPFPNLVRVKGQIYETVEIPRPSPPYVTLEILSKDKNVCKGIHVITLSQKNQIRLGRGHDSDIRINDISVSRCHAILSYDSGTFKIEDHNSKFGTLALINQPIQLNNQNNNIAVQIGRTVLSFILKKNWKIYQAKPQAPKTSAGSEKSDRNSEKKSGKIRIIEAGLPQQEEKIVNGKEDDREANLRIPSGSPYADKDGFEENKNDGFQNKSPNDKDGGFSPSERENTNHFGNHVNPTQANQNEQAIFFLPEFKDPAEELEQFQNEKEKEAEIENLQKQIALLQQHKNLNQENLHHAEELKNEVEKSSLVHRIEQYSEKIAEIQNRLEVLNSQQKQERNSINWWQTKQLYLRNKKSATNGDSKNSSSQKKNSDNVNDSRKKKGPHEANYKDNN